MYKVVGEARIYGVYEEAVYRAEELGLEVLDSILELDDYEVDGINTRDYPDFVDAFISWAVWNDGTELTDDELDELNEDADFVHEVAHNYFY